MMERLIVFYYDSSRFTLYMPAALIKMPVGNLKKILRLAVRENWRNENSIQAFFACIPETLNGLENEWKKASLAYQKDYRSTKFYKTGDYIVDREERQKLEELKAGFLS